MDKTHEPVLPRYAKLINDIAVSKGIAVRTTLENGGLVSSWEGTEHQLRATQLMPPSWRFPIHGGAFYARVFSGSLTVHGSRFSARVEHGAPPISIESRGGIEVCAFPDRVAYFGPADALVSGKVCPRNRLPGPALRAKNGGGDQEPFWVSRPFPDGSILHVHETPAGAAARLAERATRWRDKALANEAYQSFATKAHEAATVATTEARKASATDTAYQTFMSRALRLANGSQPTGVLLKIVQDLYRPGPTPA